ncbi:MAG TPA: endonuclease/exonuclease/phosphatase family protein [Solirubrobacterales bacterium]|nr:endonuclease/exonuclease/phosphatase family protein [Solirubrobacterales bacterium]
MLAAIAAVFVFALMPALAAGHGQSHGHGKSHGHGHHQGHGNGHHKGHGHHGFRGRGKAFDTMTRNLYLGANLTPAIGAPSLEALAAANGQILREVTHNDFPTRAEGLAEEIIEQKPDLVGLQEVALWRTAPPSVFVLQTGPSAETVRYDYLAELLAELNDGKKRYEVVVVQNEFDLEAPADENGVAGDGIAAQGIPNAEINGRLTMRDVILARHGAGVQTWNEQGANFNTLLEVPILGTPLPIKRGWTATDAKVRGSHRFRFVNTHLEAFHPLIRQAQAAELVAPGGPATSDRPVVLVGDLNSDDDTVEGADRLAYELLLANDMVNRSTDDPLSCCLDASEIGEFDGGSVADFDHQVDHIMTRDPDNVKLRSSTVTGLFPVNGFWNSDHAGVFSALRFVR